MELHLAQAAMVGAQLEQSVFRQEKAGSVESILIDLPESVQHTIRLILAETLKQPYWSGINQTALNRLETAIQTALREGMNLNEMARLVGQSLGIEASSARAIAIARTETTNSLNSGSYAVRKDLEAEGLIKGQTWLATMDQFTRPEHVDADGQTVSVNEPFIVGGEQAPWPGHYSLSAGNRINCRCTTLSETILDDIIGG